ncbi:hypothetical protein JKG41_03860 [Acidithiobacillus sp. MC2.1]|nr:hypothetical protein [Acidithiobacillus sp. MC2.2]MBN6744214.1 hypothetical protein [Acidithiobacillus sp. MC2.2]
MLKQQFVLDVADEIVVDLFAGGGGMSTAMTGGSSARAIRYGFAGIRCRHRLLRR